LYDLLNLARIADDIYGPSAESALLRDWSTDRVQDVVTKDNFQVRVYWRKSHTRIACVCFRGTANWKDAVYADLGGIGLGLNALAMKLNDAVEFTSMIARRADIVWLTGHSLGGCFVQLVGSILNLPGVSWNAPGALALVNQLSASPVRKFVGGAGSAGVGFLASLGTFGLGGKLVDMLNKAAAASGPEAFVPIANFRGNADPVSLFGSHVGMEMRTLACTTMAPHPHSMVPIIKLLESGKR
jgi:hypothetical protein